MILFIFANKKHTFWCEVFIVVCTRAREAEIGCLTLPGAVWFILAAIG